MAKVKFGGGVALLRGTIGGTIFSNNKGGNYAKNYNTPTNPQTVKQQAVRATFSTLATAWGGLTQAQRDAWITQAATIEFINSVGDPYYLSGNGLFQKSNQTMLSAGQAVLEDCPGQFKVPDSPAIFTIAGSEGGASLTITSDDATVPAGYMFLIDGSPQSGAGRTNNNSVFKRLGAFDSAANFDAENVHNIYGTVFGADLEGQRIELRVQSMDKENGFVSPFQKAWCIVAA